MYQTTVVQMFGYADESNVDVTGVVMQFFVKDVFVESEGFAHLTFYTVAVNGMVEAFLGHGNKHTHRWNR